MKIDQGHPSTTLGVTLSDAAIGGESKGHRAPARAGGVEAARAPRRGRP